MEVVCVVLSTFSFVFFIISLLYWCCAGLNQHDSERNEYIGGIYMMASFILFALFWLTKAIIVFKTGA